MTSTDNPTGALTRRQLRELRLTGQTPTIGDVVDAEDIAPPQRKQDDALLDAAPAEAETPVAAVPLPRAAEPVQLHETIDAAKVDVTAPPRTRREARVIDQVRTASTPVVSAETPIPAVPAQPTAAEVAAERPVFDPPAEMAVPEVVAEVLTTPAAELEPELAETTQPPAPRSAFDATIATGLEPAVVDVPDVADDVAADIAAEDDAAAAGTETETAATDLANAEAERPILRPEFGSAVLEAAVAEAPVPSFDDLLSQDQDGSGSSLSGSALILTDGAGLPPLTAPVTATGEVLVTGTFQLPEGLGSQGHAPGVADGKDVDVVLIDGELPAASSPTPIAATAAVSQAKAPGEIIKPPVPEKSNKTMLALAITAGILALVLGGVSYYVLTSGVLG